MKNDTQAGTEGRQGASRARPGNRRRRSERTTRESGLLAARGPTFFAQCLGTSASALSFVARQLLGRVLALGLPSSLSSDYAFSPRSPPPLRVGEGPVLLRPLRV
ncbi:unnamed protein product [Sphagnum jensenii]|uniref:Uncharacterized protein n=1 Tax=Sphagnum jensenii TaxID=128206 RepID=A0ABP1BGV9_9BRYO